MAGNLPTDITFTGQRSDATGLMHFGARYFSATLGRFISADTIVPGAGNPQAFNRYSYTLGNPLKYTDPTGHRACGDGDGWYNDSDCDGNRGERGDESFGCIVCSLNPDSPSVQSAAETLKTGFSVFCDLCDAVFSAEDCASGNCSPWMLLGALPIIPSSWGDEIVEGLNAGIRPMLGKFDVGAGFTGVFDRLGENMLLRPSGDTLLKTGDVPTGRVPRRGGHEPVQERLAKLVDNLDRAKTVGFAVIYDTSEKLIVTWDSGVINLTNYFNRAAPVEYRQQIVNLLEKFSGLTVESK